MSTPPPRPSQLDSPLLPKIFRIATRVHIWVYRRTGGRLGGRWRIGAGFRKPVPTLLLNHRGRKSGRHHTTPLLYMQDGANTIVVASQGGLPRHPQWYRNLIEHPDTTIEVKQHRIPVRARTAEQQERAQLWPQLVDTYADFDTYQAWTEREIPVVILEPRAAE